VNLVFNYGLGMFDQAFKAVGFVSHDNFGRSCRGGFDLETRYYVLQYERGLVSVFANYT
jgi:hypothetical protein